MNTAKTTESIPAQEVGYGCKSWCRIWEISPTWQENGPRFIHGFVFNIHTCLFLRYGFSCPDQQATLNPLVLFILYHPCEFIGIVLLCFVFGMLLWIPFYHGRNMSVGTWWNVIHVIHPESLVVLGVIQGSEPCADLPKRKLEGHPNDRKWLLDHGDRNSPISRVMNHLDMALVYISRF